MFDDERTVPPIDPLLASVAEVSPIDEIVAAYLATELFARASRRPIVVEHERIAHVRLTPLDALEIGVGRHRQVDAATARRCPHADAEQIARPRLAAPAARRRRGGHADARDAP